MQSINLNQSVKVKLSDVGLKILSEHYSQYDFKTHNIEFKQSIDDEGHFKTQLWDLMNIFGKHIHMVYPNPFESTEIILLD